MKESLADRGDGEELIDSKFGGVHLTDNRLQPSQVHMSPASDVGTGLLIGCKFLNLDRIDSHSWNKVSRQR